MKRAFILSLCMLMLTVASAQTQQGVVKTKGRMVNGQLLPGTKLGGAVISVRGRSAVLSQANGQFSFPVSGQSFMLDSVRKKGYQLVDAEAAPRSYAVTKNPLYVLMETPEQQLQDKLTAERKIRRTLQQQLQKREDEIEALKESKRITEEEYRQQLQQLYQSQESNEKLIADMAKRYAEMDFDQLDSLNRRISDAILNGRLTEADSLLRSKGDISDRIAEVKREQQAEAQEEEELARRQSNLEASKAGTQKKLEDLAEDCLNRHELCKMQLQFDSAAYYIVQRAELDTMNADWQHEAALFLADQNQFKQAELYYNKAYVVLEGEMDTDNNDFLRRKSSLLHNMALLYYYTRRFDKSEYMYKQALKIRQRLAKDNPHAYERDMAMTLNNLALMYSYTQRFSEAEPLYQQALEIYQRWAKDTSEPYELDVIHTLGNLARLYSLTQRHTEAEQCYNVILDSLREKSKKVKKTFEPDIAIAIGMLADLYYNCQRFIESENMYTQALEIRQRLAKENPHAHEPYIAQTLNNLAALYSSTQRFTEAEDMYKQALAILFRLAKDNHKTYEPDVAQTLFRLASLYSYTQRFTEGEEMYRQALEIYLRLTKDNSQAYEVDVASTRYLIGLLLIEKEHYTDAIQSFEEALEMYRKLAIEDFSQQEYFFNSLYYLSQLYAETNNHLRNYEIQHELLPLLKEMYEKNADNVRNTYATTLGSQSFNAIFMRKYAEAEQLAREGLAVDSTQHWITTNLAHALLMQGRYSEAEVIYRQYKDELKEGLLDDFEQFKAAGVIPKEREADVEKIKRMLEE